MQRSQKAPPIGHAEKPESPARTQGAALTETPEDAHGRVTSRSLKSDTLNVLKN